MRCLLVALMLCLSTAGAGAEVLEGTVTAVPRPTLDVTGRGTVRVAPDTVRVTARILTEGATVVEARERNARIVQQALAGVAGLGLPDAASRTVDYTMQRVTREAQVQVQADPQKWDLPWRSTVAEGTGTSSFELAVPVTLGYQASNSLTVRVQGVPPEQLSSAAGRIVDALMEAGCDQISSVAWSLERAGAYDQAVRRAKVLAVEDAAATAEALATASGRRLAGIRHMEPERTLPLAELISNQYPVTPRSGYETTTAINVGMLEVSAQVSVRYEFEYNPGDTRVLPGVGR